MYIYRAIIPSFPTKNQGASFRHCFKRPCIVNPSTLILKSSLTRQPGNLTLDPRPETLN